MVGSGESNVENDTVVEHTALIHATLKNGNISVGQNIIESFQRAQNIPLHVIFGDIFIFL